MLKAAICGGSGYTGGELIRLLLGHPNIKVSAITSERSAGKSVTDIFPHLTGLTGLRFEPLEPDRISKKADIIFLALPHAASQDAVNHFFQADKHVIDLSADFRLRDPKTYEKWYGIRHKYTDLLKKAVYGLPEIHRRKISRARLVANPGCYPTGAVLGILPLLRAGIIERDSIVVDSKSGTSGAGRKADEMLSFCEVNESFRAYGIANHRHTPEIEQELSIAGGSEIKVNFTPHLLPVNRGILTTIYCRLKKKAETEEMLSLFRKVYGKEPFIRVYGRDRFPDVRTVRGTNYCDIGLRVNSRTNTLIVVTAIDNLIKGASGQALQNMNIMMGFEETVGLNHAAVLP